MALIANSPEHAPTLQRGSGPRVDRDRDPGVLRGTGSVGAPQPRPGPRAARVVARWIARDGRGYLEHALRRHARLSFAGAGRLRRAARAVVGARGGRRLRARAVHRQPSTPAGRRAARFESGDGGRDQRHALHRDRRDADGGRAHVASGSGRDLHRHRGHRLLPVAIAALERRSSRCSWPFVFATWDGACSGGAGCGRPC